MAYDIINPLETFKYKILSRVDGIAHTGKSEQTSDRAKLLTLQVLTSRTLYLSE